MKNLYRLLIVVILASGFYSCNGEAENIMDFDYYELSVEGRWINLAGESVKVINSDGKLKEYYAGDDMPVVDFSRHTLILAGGTTPQSPGEGKVLCFQKVKSDKYLLEVEVTHGYLTVVGFWRIAIVTPKIPSGSKVEIITKVK